MTTSADPAVGALSRDQILTVQDQFGTPAFVYDQGTLEQRAGEALAFPNPFGLTARYAMKACPNAAIVRVLNNAGLHIDASSAFEAHRAIAAGVEPADILLTAQELSPDFSALVDQGVRFNACSLNQLRCFGEAFPGSEVGVRFNPGLGSGHSRRTNVGGPSASFGIWHEHLESRAPFWLPTPASSFPRSPTSSKRARRGSPSSRSMPA
jgi:diaminopimelate decarboxylase